MYFVGFNESENIDIEDVVEKWVIENELGGDEDQWEEDEWGFFMDLGFKDDHEEIFENVEETGIQTIVSSNNKNFEKFIELVLNECDIFFDENCDVIDKKAFSNKVRSSQSCQISICECRPD